MAEKDDFHGIMARRHFMVSTVWKDYFTGRQETMSHIKMLMSREEKHRRVAIVGLGGIRKTRVMLQYAYRKVLIDFLWKATTI